MGERSQVVGGAELGCGWDCPAGWRRSGRRHLRRWRVFAVPLGVLFLSACSLILHPGPYDNWPRKEPLPGEERVFSKALYGPVSPEEPIKDGDMVGWFGVILEIKPGDKGITGVTLDHRYADGVNIRYGPLHTQSIHTVSLFGGGLFETATAYRRASAEWLPGDLLRVYGTVSKTKEGHWKIAPTYLRHWPRWKYEVAPLRPKWTAEGAIARKGGGPGGWPVLLWDHSVTTKQSPVDEQIRARLLEALAASEPAMRTRIAFTLGELGGEDAIAAISEAMGNETDRNRKHLYWQTLRRAQREVGPLWDRRAPNPYWGGATDAS